MFRSHSASSNWDAIRCMPLLSGKLAIVTGGNDGLGREMAKQLAAKGAKVYIACRSEERAKRAIEEIEREIVDERKQKNIVSKPENGNGKNYDGDIKIELMKLDLCDLKSCVGAAKEFMNKEDRLDILINNAGILVTPYELTIDGIEAQLQTNYLGHFTLTITLLPLLIKTSRLPSQSLPSSHLDANQTSTLPSSSTLGARIVCMTSNAHADISASYLGGRFKSKDDINQTFGSGLSGAWRRYAHSKLCNVLFARELSHRVEGERVWANSVHPGPTNTGMVPNLKRQYPVFRFLSFLQVFLSTPYKGAQTSLYAATAKEIEDQNISGKYLIPHCKVDPGSALSRDDKLAKDLWDLSIKIVNEATGEELGYPKA